MILGASLLAAAARPRRVERVVVVDAAKDAVSVGGMDALVNAIPASSIVVVNDAATLPASLHGQAPDGSAIELRLAGRTRDGWRAVLFGAGDWRMPTEARPAPRAVAPGDVLGLTAGVARVTQVSAVSPRLIELVFEGIVDPLRAIFASGLPIQYSYLDRALELEDVQGPFASAPWAVEMPSASRSLRVEVVLALRARGVRFATLTHAAGLSSTGDAALDAALPLPEEYVIPPATARAVNAALERKAPIVAVGTSVVRALESASEGGRVRPGHGTATLIIGRGHPLSVVDILLSGVHEPGSSHFDLLRAFASDTLLARSVVAARDSGLRAHEFGDAALFKRRVHYSPRHSCPCPS